MARLRWFSLIVLAVLAILPALPLFLSLFGEVQFNQFFIQTTQLSYGDTSVWDDFTRSAYTLGLRLLFSPPQTRLINYTNPRETFAFLFERMPDYAVVYPTETYYYYSFSLPTITIAGNLRFLDAQEGKIHIGYFDKNNPHGETWYAVLGKEDGIRIEQLSPFLFNITFRGASKTVRLTDIASRPPQQVVLLPEEKFVAHIIDESATTLFLLYNNLTHSFYYILDEERPIADTLEEAGERYLLGKRTGFVYYHDEEYNRKLLVGISRQNIFENNYFDGPFDQVPPRLPLQEKLHAAYPYTRYAGGIDEHGNFYSFGGSRVAISPYYDYEDLEALRSYLGRCSPDNKTLFWSCLTYEWKKDFHKTLENQNYTTASQQDLHPVYVSQGWPANHWGALSLSWPENHRFEKSAEWPRDHQGEGSLEAASL